MIAEMNFYGLYFPSLMLLALLALGVTRILVAMLARLNVYRWIWHPALFDFSLFIVILFCLTYLAIHRI
jgi:hypothetical protein